jgi:hypothetical protein
MEQRTLALASEPEIRTDPMLVSLLVDRADKIRALYRARELRDLLQKRNLLDLALQFMRHADARAFVSTRIRRKVAKLTSSGGART